MIEQFGATWRKADDVSKQKLLRAILEGVYVLPTDLIAILPKPEFARLLTACGPDGLWDGESHIPILKPSAIHD